MATPTSVLCAPVSAAVTLVHSRRPAPHVQVIEVRSDTTMDRSREPTVRAASDPRQQGFDGS
jgi:hypothetical protein